MRTSKRSSSSWIVAMMFPFRGWWTWPTSAAFDWVEVVGCMELPMMGTAPCAELLESALIPMVNQTQYIEIRGERAQERRMWTERRRTMEG
jgi:hypothetical protein